MSKKKLLPPHVEPIRPDSPFRVSARLFSAVALFKAEHDIRYCLNGVYFAPHPSGGVLIAATDGHQLAIAYDPHGRAAEGRVFTATKGLRAVARRYPGGTVHVADDRMIVSTARNEEVFIQPGKCVVEGQFPDIFRLLPAEPEKVEQIVRDTVGHHLLSRLGEAAKVLNISKFVCGITSWQAFAGGAVYSRFTALDDFLAITMPMRGEAVGAQMQPIPASIMAAKPVPKPPAPPAEPEPAPAPPAEQAQPEPAPEPVAPAVEVRDAPAVPNQALIDALTASLTKALGIAITDAISRP